jgi:cytochrome c-type biogenesis protein CcmH
MAEGMVARLETRLRTSPANPGGWVMLMRSRMTLGQPDKARAALRAAVAANPAEADELRRQGAALGVP